MKPRVPSETNRAIRLVMLVLPWVAVAAAADSSPPIELRVKYFSAGGGLGVSEQANDAVLARFYDLHPDIRLTSWSALRLPGEMWQQAELLAFAGGTAPDIVPLFFHQTQFYAQQGLLLPLNEFIGEDINHDGVLSNDEIRWKPWLDFPQSFRRACMVGTTIYAVPQSCYSGGFLYRRDLFQRAGLDPDHPPQTLEQWWRAAQRLTNPQKRSANGEVVGQWALGASDLVFHPFFLACGGNLVEVEWLDASDHVAGKSRIEDDPSPYLRRKLIPRYRAAFDSPEAIEGLRWIHKFRWSPWVRDAKTGEIRDLTEEEAARTPNVIRGVVRFTPGAEEDRLSLLQRGVLAMVNVTMSARMYFLQTPNVGLMPWPRLRKTDPPASFLLPMTFGINAAIRDPARRAAAWAWVAYRVGSESARIENEVYLQNGLLKILSVHELRRAGMLQELNDLPRQWREAQEHIFASDRILPYVNGWLPIEQDIIESVVKPMLADPQFDSRAALREAARRGNEKTFGFLPPATRSHRARWAALALAATVVLVVGGGWFIVRQQRKQAREAAARSLGSRGATRRAVWMAAVLLLPALALILLFQYYPVGRGSVMAFENHRLTGGSEFVGLDNFVEGLFASRLGLAAVNTLLFVTLNVALGFAAPILLALLLTEVPRGTALYRTIYYLPAVTAGLVVVLLWMRIYDPTEAGALNRLLHPVIEGWNALMPAALDIQWPIRWLQDARWAMIAVVLPSVWAGTGPGCLIYLAALKSIPEDLYEAADMDGAGIWHKLRHITIPAMFPLILISFVGACIGTFHSMGNIFVMTGGGPNYATHVLALEIWQNAFLYLRFGVATAQAWMIAAALIGFVMMQLRILGKLDWRQAGT